MRAVDTNVLVRLITRDDARQTASADAFVEKGAWVSVLALAEAVWVLEAVYKRNAAGLATAIEMLLKHGFPPGTKATEHGWMETDVVQAHEATLIARAGIDKLRIAADIAIALDQRLRADADKCRLPGSRNVGGFIEIHDRV